MPVREKGQGEPVRSLHVPSHVPSNTQTTAKVRGFSPTVRGFTAETDSPLEGAGFEPSVPRKRDLFQIRLARKAYAQRSSGIAATTRSLIPRGLTRETRQ